MNDFVKLKVAMAGSVHDTLQIELNGPPGLVLSLLRSRQPEKEKLAADEPL